MAGSVWLVSFIPFIFFSFLFGHMNRTEYSMKRLMRTHLAESHTSHNGYVYVQVFLSSRIARSQYNYVPRDLYRRNWEKKKQKQPNVSKFCWLIWFRCLQNVSEAARHIVECFCCCVAASHSFSPPLVEYLNFRFFFFLHVSVLYRDRHVQMRYANVWENECSRISFT